MGNHEYCINCGESDYHWNRPCDPKKVKKMKEQQAETSINYAKQLLKDQYSRINMYLTSIIKQFDIHVLGNHNDSSRWSHTDIMTDLTHEQNKIIESIDTEEKAKFIQDFIIHQSSYPIDLTEFNDILLGKFNSR